MCGSGTTARVACEMGRQYIGIDISHEYCELARQRVKLIEMQPRLFYAEEPREKYFVKVEEEAQHPTAFLRNGGGSTKLNSSHSKKL